MSRGILHSRFLILSLVLSFLWLLCSDLIPQQETPFQKLIQEGEHEYEQGEYQSAIIKFLTAKDLARSKKDLSETFFYLSLAYFATGDNASCEEYLKRLFEVDLVRVLDEGYVPSGYSEIYHRLQGSAKELIAKRKAEEEKPFVRTKPGKTDQIKKKRGFPILAVAGVLLGGGAVAALLISKKDGGGSSTPTTPTPTTGSIQITSTPTGAKVFLDGTDTGKTTNVTLTNVSARTHQLKLTLENYGKWEGSAQVTGGQTTNVSASLVGYKYEFVTKWGSNGRGDGQFVHPAGIAVDGSGYVYVVDYDLFGSVQKFSSTGGFVSKWGGEMGDGDGQFIFPWGIAVDNIGYVYVADSGNSRIQKLTSDGKFISKWGSYGTGDGQFYGPYGIAVDLAGYVYSTDGCRVQKFTQNGIFVTKWGTQGEGDGQFYQVPFWIALDAAGYVYLSDRLGFNERIQKFTSTGGFVSKWGSYGSGDGQFGSLCGIAADRSSNIFALDWGNHRIQKFTPNGGFISKWGSAGSQDGQFDGPNGIAIDSAGNVYVTEVGNCRLQEFRITDQTQQAGNITFKPNLRGPIPIRSTSFRKNGPLAEKTPRKDMTKEKGRAGK
jgi:hypothetical protein